MVGNVACVALANEFPTLAASFHCLLFHLGGRSVTSWTVNLAATVTEIAAQVPLQSYDCTLQPLIWFLLFSWELMPSFFISRLFCNIIGACACRHRSHNSVKAPRDLCSLCASYMTMPMLFHTFTVSRFPHDPPKTNRCLSLWEPRQIWWECRPFSWQYQGPLWISSLLSHKNISN